MAEHNQQFDSFEQWVNKASSWLTRHERYNNTEHTHRNKHGWQGIHFTALCFDARGRECRIGADFMRARDELAFPVRWVWPDQLPALLLFLTELKKDLSIADKIPWERSA